MDLFFFFKHMYRTFLPNTNHLMWHQRNKKKHCCYNLLTINWKKNMKIKRTTFHTTNKKKLIYRGCKTIILLNSNYAKITTNKVYCANAGCRIYCVLANNILQYTHTYTKRKHVYQCNIHIYFSLYKVKLKSYYQQQLR